MSIPKVVDGLMNYFSGAVSRIFGLSDDAYPDAGVQPFSGDVYDKKHVKKHFDR